MKSVVLLFGCSSVELYSCGPCVEMLGQHYMYLIGCRLVSVNSICGRKIVETKNLLAKVHLDDASFHVTKNMFLNAEGGKANKVSN